uniref:Ig-like domain-containing protein n=1 Tax=Zonotrichia albicollis TaxID=44394 RepID=A0A8D2M432_ZONAL
TGWMALKVTGQVALEQQPRRVTMREGDEFTFHCSMKGGDMDDYNMYWYRQGPWGSLEWIYVDGANTYGEGFEDHFKGSWDSSQTTLQLLAAEQGNAATYYCGGRITLDQHGLGSGNWA